jgi:hypothetical protein
LGGRARADLLARKRTPSPAHHAVRAGRARIARNDERMHHYQRGRASITGLMIELRKNIETGRLVMDVMTRIVMHLHSVRLPMLPCPTLIRKFSSSLSP